MIAPRALALSAALCAACVGPSRLVSARWVPLTPHVSADLRGLSVVDDRVAWASGTGGVWLRTADGGATWESGAIEGGLDLRSLVAFDAFTALALNAGSPARLFRTTDGGLHWTAVYRDDRPDIFFDSMTFADAQRGYAVGDPIGGRFVLLVTGDGGKTWTERPGPEAMKGEGAFAASNTCLAARGNDVWLVTGGAVSRVHHSADGGASWTSSRVEAPASVSAGIFSIAMRDRTHGALVGGDYKLPKAPGFFSVTRDGGATWSAGPPPPGYRSSVAFAGGAVVVAGTSGTDWTPDAAGAFRPLGAEAFNAVAFAGLTGYAVGPKGAVARLRVP